MRARHRLTCWWMVAVALATMGAAGAGADAGPGWTPVGVNGGGGELSVLAGDGRVPSTVYARTQLGLVKSTDGGVSWSAIGSPPGGFVLSAAVEPAPGGALYVQAGDNSVWRSDDEGGHYTQVREPATNADAEFIATGPGIVLHTRNFDLYASTDRGTSWRRIYGTGALRPSVNPADPAKLYFQTTVGGLMQSSDGGATWAATGPVVSGDPFRAITEVVLGLTAAAPSALFASVGEVFYRSLDNGASWVELSRPGAFTTVAVDPQSPARLYGLSGFFDLGVPSFSSDGGLTWSQVKDLPPAQFFLDGSSELEGLVFVNGTHRAVGGSHYSGAVDLSDDVASWLMGAEASLPTGPIHFLKFSPSDPRLLWAGTAIGLSTSSTDGQAWTSLPASLLPELDDLELDPASPSTLFAAAGGHGQGVLRSDDSGQTWARAGSALLLGRTTALLRRDGDLLAGGIGIQRSFDGGHSWRQVLAQSEPDDPTLLRLVDRLIGDPANQRVAYAVVEIAANRAPVSTSRTLRLYRTRDGGRHWRAIGGGFSALAIDPAATARLFAGDPAGTVQLSEDGGRTWSLVGSVGAPINDLLVDDRASGALLAATSGKGVLRSTDGGSTWQPLNDGLAERGRTAIGRLIADPGSGPGPAHQIFALPLVTRDADLGQPGLFFAFFPGP